MLLEYSIPRTYSYKIWSLTFFWLFIKAPVYQLSALLTLSINISLEGMPLHNAWYRQGSPSFVTISLVDPRQEKISSLRPCSFEEYLHHHIIFTATPATSLLLHHPLSQIAASSCHAKGSTINTDFNLWAKFGARRSISCYKNCQPLGLAPILARIAGATQPICPRVTVA